MKIRQILIKVKTLNEMAAGFKRVWKKAAKDESTPPAVETICFESVEDMQKFLSPERIRLLNAIHERRPASILALARLLERDRKNVSEDVKMLEAVGLLERKVTKKEKNKVELVVDYDRIRLEIALKPFTIDKDAAA